MPTIGDFAQTLFDIRIKFRLETGNYPPYILIGDLENALPYIEWLEEKITILINKSETKEIPSNNFLKNSK